MNKVQAYECLILNNTPSERGRYESLAEGKKDAYLEVALSLSIDQANSSWEGK
jgi:hypothetical protein